MPSPASNSQFPAAARILAGRSFPIDNVYQLPGILTEVYLQLSFFIDHELSGRIQQTRILTLVLVVQVEFTCGQVEGLRLGVKKGFTEFNLTVSDKANFP